MVKMKKSGLGLVIPKTLRIGGVTFYQRGGQVIGRVSESRKKRSNTLAQFIQRQKLRHTTALWKMLRYAEPMHALPTVHDRRSPAACRQELWRHHRQALSFAKIVEEGYTLKILFEKIKRE